MDELTDDDWRSQYELHVVAPMRLMRLAAPRMAASGRRADRQRLLVSAGKRPSLTNPAYSVTKAAQLSLSRERSPTSTPPTTSSSTPWRPGPVGTPLWLADGGLAEQNAARRAMTREEALAEQASKVPLGRFAEPGEIADVIVFLCSARASTVTGAAWSADGGAVAIII